jgi:CBS-domain-containing membrane protein
MSEHFIRIGGQALAAILGGPGIFYVWYSFYQPVMAASAIILLGAALALSVSLYPDSFPRHDRALKLIRRIAGRVARLTDHF